MRGGGAGGWGGMGGRQPTLGRLLISSFHTALGLAGVEDQRRIEKASRRVTETGLKRRLAS